jgi:hypothetical protein
MKNTELAAGVRASAQRIATLVDSQNRGHTVCVKPQIKALRDQLNQLERKVAA